MEQEQRIGALEAILFVNGEPVPMERLEKTLCVTTSELEQLVRSLQEKLSFDASSGLCVSVYDNKVLLATKSEHAPIIEQLTKSTLSETLSRAVLEVLSIIAYRAPISKADIEAIRGVNCSFTLRTLLLRDLIEREGNPQDNRGYLYRPTLKFLQSLGLSSLEALPDFEVLRNDDRMKQCIETETVADGSTESLASESA